MTFAPVTPAPVTPAPVALPLDDWAGFVTARCAAFLTQVSATATSLKAGAAVKDGAARTPAEVLRRWNDIDSALRQSAATASLLAEVHPDEEVRTLCEERGREIDRISTELSQDRQLYDVLAAAEADSAGDPHAGGSQLDAAARRLLRLTLRDFRRAGVDRDEATRARLRELTERAVQLGQDFSRTIRDDVRSIRISADRLAGLPADYLQAHPADADGMVTITTDYPDIIPFRSFGHDAQARLELTVQFLCRGWPDNDARLRELLAVRAERARLLGYPSWPDFDAEVKMIGTGAAIAAFIERISAAAQASSERDRAVLLERLRRDRPEASSLTSADATYYAELIRVENFDVDAQQVRRYFDFSRVRAGLLEVTGRLFGLGYEPVTDAASWHPDVTVHDVIGPGGERLGRIYLDLHPRPGKFKHAAQFDLATGVRGRTLPEGALVCNLPRGLMEHSDVVTLFHEFGHLVHHVLGGHQDWARFSGVATEWDFVEAPSQMLEEWAWDADVLRTFAVDETGEPIPVELVTRMRAAKEFGKGYQARTQMFYAALSYVLHSGPVADLTETVRELQGRYDAFDYLEGTHFHTSFGHLEGYTSGYYTYMWSLVIAKDLFSAFDPGDLLAPGAAQRYRDLVLAPGGSADAAELVAAFLGRPYDFAAFTRWLDAPPA